VKVSPLYDLSQLSIELPGLSFIKVVSVRGEVKEILAGMEAGIKAGSPKISAVILHDNGGVQISVNEDPDTQPGTKSAEELQPGEAVCFPDSAVTKAGLVAELASQTGLKRLSPGHDLLAGSAPESSFPGRVFRLLEIMPFNPSKVKKKLGRNGIRTAHIYRRNFPMAVEELHKKFRLPMGEDAHLLFMTDESSQNWCLLLELIP
jgi:hypothetical protein